MIGGQEVSYQVSIYVASSTPSFVAPSSSSSSSLITGGNEVTSQAAGGNDGISSVSSLYGSILKCLGSTTIMASTRDFFDGKVDKAICDHCPDNDDPYLCITGSFNED
jgi:hypothetical protein